MTRYSQAGRLASLQIDAGVGLAFHPSDFLVSGFSWDARSGLLEFCVQQRPQTAAANRNPNRRTATPKRNRNPITAINAGNSGGPAFADIGTGLVAGVAFSKNAGTSTDNIGYIIPSLVVEHFLVGALSGAAAKGGSVQPSRHRAAPAAEGGVTMGRPASNLRK
jgi:hypothetical protein